MEKAKKKTPWILPRHKAIVNFLLPIIGPFTRHKYGVTVTPFPEGKTRPYLIISNHTTGFDQFFVSMAFRSPVYYVATEDIFSNGWISRLLQWAVNPIPIKKQVSDSGAVMKCVRVAKEGGTIALFPEGNRTYSGKQVYIKPAVAKMAKLLKLPIAFFRIEEGYGVQPRWSDCVRKGKMRAYVASVMEPEECRAMSDEELLAEIQRRIDVNEAAASQPFLHPKQAEYLERAMYVCPDCGLSEFESHGDTITCKQCGWQIRHLPTKELEGITKPFPFRFVSDWYEWQNDFIRNLDLEPLADTPLYADDIQLSEVILYDRKHLLYKKATLRLYTDRLTIDTPSGQLVLPFAELGVVTVLGKNKLNIYHGDQIYQIKGSKRFNALKYVNLYHRAQPMEEGGNHVQFLGL